MFLKSFGSNLILAVVALGLVFLAVPETKATVILCESELSADRGFGEELSAWITIDPVAVARESSLGGMTGLPLLPTDEEREEEAQKDRMLKIAHGSLMTAPAGMSPSPSTLSQTVSGAGGFAAPSDIISPPQAELQASLPPEGRTILPTGPPWRWFRPPR